jgi:hypothetical protein
MAKNDLDKEYAAQILLLKSLRSEGFISKEVYEKYVYRYSRPVTPGPEPKKLTLADLKQQQKIEEETRYFEAILKGEWAKHEGLEWRHKVLAKAEKYKDQIPQAQSVLDLGAYLL